MTTGVLLGIPSASAVAGTSFEEMVALVNTQGASWKAEVQTRFGSYDDVEQLCGTMVRGSATFREMNHDKTMDWQ